MKWLFACLGIVSIAVACRASKETLSINTPLFDTKWSLKKLYDGDNAQAVDTKAFIRFDKEKASAGGNGSCNSFGSTASVNGNEITFKNIFSTKMYCDQVQQVENRYFKQLQNANRFEIKGKELILYRDTVRLLAFAADADPK